MGIALADVQLEENRLDQASSALAAEFESARAQLLSSQPDAPYVREQAELLNAYSMICRDPKMLAASKTIIREKLISAEYACEQAVLAIAGTFEKIDSPYLRERAVDVRAVGERIVSILRGEHLQRQLSGTEKYILFAHDLTPADTLALSPEKILGLATEMGGRTSHTGILARSMHRPCVVGITDLEKDAADGQLVVIDGIRGQVVINPDENELHHYTALQNRFEEYEGRLRKEALLPAETEDGIRVAVYGNIENGAEAGLSAALGAEGIGLFRTEFGYITRRNQPTEDELYEEYAKAVKLAAPGRVVLRTLDVGADKTLAGTLRLEEDNPVLGLRAIRYCMRHQDIFRRQLRAILRASAHGRAAVMFPMISGLHELKQAKSILGEVRQELDNEGIAYDKDIPLGAMIELPSAVFMAQALAREVNFFSIGTNDLIQYILGIDRGNKYVAYLYQPLHPAVIQAIRLVVDAAHEAGITVCVCGEMAADPYCLTALLAMGIDEFSLNPQSIPMVKYIIRHMDTEELRELQRRVYNSNSTRTTSKLIKQYLYERIPGELSFIDPASDTDV